LIEYITQWAGITLTAWTDANPDYYMITTDLISM